MTPIVCSFLPGPLNQFRNFTLPIYGIRRILRERTTAQT